MSGKMKILGATLALALAVAVGAVVMGATVFAEEPTPTTQEAVEQAQQKLLARVAEILGIEEQKVTDAFDQATSELRTEALQDHLQQLVDEGKITQDEADQYLDWWSQRPDVLDKGLLPGFGGRGFGRGFGGGHMWGGLRGCVPSNSAGNGTTS